MAKLCMMSTACLPQHFQNPTRANRSSALIRNSYLSNKQMIIYNSCLGLVNTQDERFTPFYLCYQDHREWLLTFGLGIIILQGVSRRKSLAGVNIMRLKILSQYIIIFLIINLNVGYIIKPNFPRVTFFYFLVYRRANLDSWDQKKQLGLCNLSTFKMVLSGAQNNTLLNFKLTSQQPTLMGTHWCSGRVLGSWSRGCGFDSWLSHWNNTSEIFQFVTLVLQNTFKWDHSFPQFYFQFCPHHLAIWGPLM
jgi:hypothetical protein